MNYYKTVLKKYAVFTGRSTRSEYWYFVLFNILISLVLTLIGRALGSKAIEDALTGIYAIAVLLPSIGVTIRRLHDTDRTGWWILINFIPIIGWIVMLVFLVTDSQPGTNKYGPNPKEVVVA